MCHSLLSTVFEINFAASALAAADAVDVVGAADAAAAAAAVADAAAAAAAALSKDAETFHDVSLESMDSQAAMLSVREA